MALLITPTLLDAYDWFNKAPNSKSPEGIPWKRKAFEDLRNKLSRSPWKPNAAVTRGMDFEKKVYANCNRNMETFNSSDIFKEVCQEFTGGDFQKTIKKIIVVDDREFLLYGKTDGWWPEIIKDLKTTKEYKGKSKYLGGWQHIMYCYVSGIPLFKYVVVEWDLREKDDTKLVPAEVFMINYEMKSREENKQLIAEKIRDIMSFVESDDELNEFYHKKFNKYGN